MKDEFSREYQLCTLLIEVTQKCNALCDQCGSRCDPKGDEVLSKEDILSALADIKENIGTAVMINITGGEPLMRHDLFELTKGITELGFDWGMVSNGSLLNDNTIQKLKESGLKTLTVSIDGLPETHESLRHLKGSFNTIITALKKLKKENFLDHLQVTFTANRRNVFEFEELYKILNPIGLDSIRVGLMDPIGRANDFSELLLSNEEIVYFTALTNRLNAEKDNTPIIWGCPHFMGDMIDNRNFTCFAGIYAASILFNGDIFVCPNVQDRVNFVQGNILRDSFSEVWKNKFQFFRNLPLPEKCKTCKYRAKCKGDSVHTMDFEKGEPKFCYKERFEEYDTKRHIAFLKKQYPELSLAEISADDNSDVLLIEPEAFQGITEYFHIGKRSPLSMFEQQMALVGFEVRDGAVVRYVIPCDGKLRDKDNAIFSKDILKKVKNEVTIINENYFKSSDRTLFGAEMSATEPMKFLGFIHSHPIQQELQYSMGDELIHKRMFRRFGVYYGVLVNPETSQIGAYYGEKINQARLIIPDNK